MRKLYRKKACFTLIEVLIVVAIVGLLSSAVVSAVNPLTRSKQTRDATRKQNLSVLYRALVGYYTDHGTLPYAGEDLASSSNEANWLQELVPSYLKTIPKDPKHSGIIGALASLFSTLTGKQDASFEDGRTAGVAIPSKSNSYQMPVLVINYMPTNDNVNIDSSITGINASLSAMRSHVSNIKDEVLVALEDGSKFRGTGSLAMDYSIVAEREYLEALPIGLPLEGGIYRPDYMQILNRENICNYVNNQGVKEVWLFGYHYGNIAPAESNMAGPNGDVSNSERTADMPVCSKTYVMYNYNYGRGSNEAVHDHGHQIEAVLKHVGDPSFENKFIGPFSTYSDNDGSGSNYHRCGWTHMPPNTSGGYDYTNTTSVWTDCEDWKPDGSGSKVYINCSRWQCIERKFHSWRWQQMPGKDNNVAGASNWWDFIGDFDAAISSGQKLLYDVNPPTVPTGLSSSNIYSTQLTLNWNASTDDESVAGYKIKRNGSVVGTSIGTSFTDYTVAANTSYQYTVLAVDSTENESLDSNPLNVSSNSTLPTGTNRPVLDAYSYKIGGNTQKSYSWYHSVGNGQNKLLLVTVGIRGFNSVSSVTYKGVNLTRKGFYATGGLRTEFWYLTNPDSGINQVTVTLQNNPSGGGSVAGASSWFSVDQANPLGTIATAEGFSSSPSVNVSTSATDAVVDVAVMPSGGGAVTAGSGQTLLYSAWSIGDTRVMSSTKDATGATTNMSWITPSEAYNISGVSIKYGVSAPLPSPGISPQPSPTPVDACPQQENVYCYVVTPTLDSFVLWADLEFSDDAEIWNKASAKCQETPPDEQYYNFCIKY